MRNKLFTIAVLMTVFISTSYAQQHYGNRFMIAPNYYFNQFSIDRIGQKIYADLYGGRVHRVDLRTMQVDTPRFAGIDTVFAGPVFGNKRHIMLWGGKLLDMDTGSLYKLAIPDSPMFAGSLTYSFPILFSPNDSNFMFSLFSPTPPYLVNGYIFSLKDSSLTQMDTSVNFTAESNGLLVPQWSSDTSFVYGISDSCLVEYFVRSRRIDTLVTLHDYHRIVSFAYNAKEDFLAYSVAQYHGYPPLIYFHFKEPAKDSLAFSPFRDDTTSVCWTTPISIRYLSWSPDYRRLGFVTSLNTNSNAGIYFYSLDSSRTYRATICEDRDLKNGLTWANEDTLVYWDSDDGHIYGMDITPVIDAVQIKTNKPIATDFSISSYPNPFNPSTTIAITLPWHMDGTLSIYDVQGQLVRQYHIKNVGRANYRITWPAVNSRGEKVSSGLYLAVLLIDDSHIQSRKVTKLIYLK